MLLEKMMNNYNKKQGDFLKMMEFLSSYNKQKCSVPCEINDVKFCLIIKEAQTESKREKMTFVISFGDIS
ncbi:hypothetical protein SADUNF_Sadunf16G0231700 [Salix dunnii]|uniref:Uncharacterized protein n=1 Tax=Salix dunnii TaxID=1413687 RepID=A0A835JBP8_9ROSI|nr:hypothetical protein SADUNF_Sadunf16G0231700 [Salix dunnii]